MKSKSLAIVLLTLVSACDIAEKRNGGTSPSDNAIFTYFTSRQYMSDDADVQKMSTVWGVPMVAGNESTFQTSALPTFGCGRIEDGVRVPLKAKRYIDIGKFYLLGLTPNEALPLDRMSESEPIYVVSKSLPTGDYTIKVGDEGTPVQFTQPLTVPAVSDTIIIQSGEDGTAEQLPSPKVPAETDSNYEIAVSRTKNLYIGFQAPPDVNYARVSIQDWIQETDGTYSEGTVYTCFVDAAQQVFGIEQTELAAFRPGLNGTISVDFVKINLTSNVDKVKETFMESMVRQVHGLVLTGNDKGQQKAIHLGVLKFE